MNYEFISNEKAKQDLENGLVQIEHLGKGESGKLVKLFGLKMMGNANYYIRDRIINYRCGSKFPNIPSVPTDELYDMVFGEGKYKPEQREIIGYELNGEVGGKINEVEYGISLLLDCTVANIRPLKKHELIQRAKDLGILSTCFNPIYKEKEVKVKLSNGLLAFVSKEKVLLTGVAYSTLSITDIQKILDAHKTL